MSSAAGHNTVTDGLVLCLDATDIRSYAGSGTVWYDRSNNGNNGTLTNGPTYSSANGGSILFDGSNDYIGINSSFTHPSTNSFSISFWSKTAKKPSGSWHSFLSTRELSTFAGILITEDFQSNRSDYLRVQLNSSTVVSQYNSGTIKIPDNIFCYITICVDRVTNVMTWYINSIFDSQYNITGLGNILSTHLLEIGRDEAFMPDVRSFTQGNISQVSIYNKALSQSEILQNYNAMKGRYGL